MAVRPYWSGLIRISLVSFPVTLNSALQRGSQIPLNEIDRETGERIHHRNVLEDGTEVPRENIIKGFKTEDDEYVLLEPEEIDDIKLPSSNTLELVMFTKLSAIALPRFERPYFVLPDGKDAEEIYAVIHEALLDSGKAGIGQIAMRGKEELCAVVPRKEGLALETLRYDQELLDAKEFYPDFSKRKLKSDYVDLANQLIEKNTVPANFSQFHDHYHEALLELIEAKKAHRKPRLPKAAKQPEKVVDFMDALRKSLRVKSGKPEPRSHSPRRKSA